MAKHWDYQMAISSILNLSEGGGTKDIAKKAGCHFL
jgi:hypothetical protein